MDEHRQHSVVRTDPIDIFNYLFPNELQVTNAPLKKILLIGSCLSEQYRSHFCELDPELEVQHIFLNNLQRMPDLTTDQLDTHQLQYIQLPLREVLTDRIMRICDIDRAEAFGEILEDARAKLAVMLDSAMAYNKQHGLLTLVANFFVPQGHAAPSLADLGGENDLITLIAEVNRTLTQLVAKYRNAFVADVNSLANSYGKRNFLDDIIYFYSHGAVLAPYEPDVGVYQLQQPQPFFRLVLDQIRYLHRVVSQVDQVKIVIFDLDNTLWRGQIAEDYETGREWPHLHNWPVGMWETVHHLRRRGIVVSLCSKNDENLVRDRWSRAVNLPWISLDDFIAPKINWKPKSENVRAILSELNLTSKSALFVDDSPVERSEVLNGVPGIRAIGGNPFVTRRILLWSAETQRSVLTDESINRETSYRGIVARNAEMALMDRESFLQSLQIRIKIDRISDLDSPLLPRVLELANKTTQFNTTGLKWTPSELTDFIENHGSIFIFSVQDKFADYGLVGAVFVSESVVRQFVMSCRVLGNDVEVDALKQILELVRDEDKTQSIYGEIIPTEANGPCRDIYLRSGFQETESPNTFAILKATLGSDGFGQEIVEWEDGQDRSTAAPISTVTQCPRDDVISAAYLDHPRTGPVDGPALEVNDWTVSKAPTVNCDGSVKVLDAIAMTANTDKSSLRHDNTCAWDYCRHYEELFGDLRHEPINLIEIGVAGGQSLEMWLRYFTRARIVGIDNNPDCSRHARGRAEVRIGSQDDEKFLRSIAADSPPTIVVDDGSHIAAHIMKSFEVLFPLLVPGGFYAIEDVYFHYHRINDQILPNPPHPDFPSEPLHQFLQRLILAKLAYFNLEFPYSDIDQINIVGGALVIRKSRPRDHLKMKVALEQELDRLATYSDQKYGIACCRMAEYLLTYHNAPEKALQYLEQGAAISPDPLYGLQLRRLALQALGCRVEAEEIAERLRSLGVSPDLRAFGMKENISYPHG